MKGKHLKLIAIIVLVAAIVFMFWANSLAMKSYNESLKDAKEDRSDHRSSKYCDGSFCDVCEDYDDRIDELSDIITRARLGVLTEILMFVAVSGMLYGVGCLVSATEAKANKQSFEEYSRF